MTKLYVERGIPVPPPGGRASAESVRGVLRSLDVGESVLLPGAKVNSLGSTIAAVKRNTDKTFTARSVDGGVRIWRTA